MQLSGRVVVFCKTAKSKRLKLCNTACVRKALGVLLCQSQADHPTAPFEHSETAKQKISSCVSSVHLEAVEEAQNEGGQSLPR